MVIYAERTKEGFKTVRRNGDPADLDLEPLAEILLERMMQSFGNSVQVEESPIQGKFDEEGISATAAFVKGDKRAAAVRGRSAG